MKIPGLFCIKTSFNRVFSTDGREDYEIRFHNMGRFYEYNVFSMRMANLKLKIYYSHSKIKNAKCGMRNQFKIINAKCGM